MTVKRRRTRLPPVPMLRTRSRLKRRKMLKQMPMRKAARHLKLTKAKPSKMKLRLSQNTTIR